MLAATVTNLSNQNHGGAVQVGSGTSAAHGQLPSTPSGLPPKHPGLVRLHSNSNGISFDSDKGEFKEFVDVGSQTNEGKDLYCHLSIARNQDYWIEHFQLPRDLKNLTMKCQKNLYVDFLPRTPSFGERWKRFFNTNALNNPHLIPYLKFNRKTYWISKTRRSIDENFSSLLFIQFFLFSSNPIVQLKEWMREWLTSRRPFLTFPFIWLFVVLSGLQQNKHRTLFTIKSFTFLWHSYLNWWNLFFISIDHRSFFRFTSKRCRDSSEVIQLFL